MTTQQRVLLSIGGSILVVMMVIGAFSIGVYVGSERSSSPALPGPQPGGGGGNNVLQRLPGPPDILGEIVSITGDSMLLRTPDGPRTVSLSEGTQVMLEDGSEGSRQDLHPGQVVAVIGRFEEGGKSLAARLVAVMPPLR